MNARTFPTRARARIRSGVMVLCSATLLGPGAAGLLAQENAQTPPPASPPDTTAAQSAAKIPPEQIESLVAPIALYPDDLLAQTLVASTYPLEIVQLQQWLAKHKDLKEKALADSVAKQPWDPSIQSMAGIPEVVDRLANDIQWTTDLGNAFLAQQADVMDAVQRMRKKAQDSGALESNEQMKVETKVVEKETIIVVESTNPEVIYVPSYSPVVVYGPPVYPYPPIYYPPYPVGGAFIGFSMGVMWGAAWGGSCCGCGWGGGNDIYINNSNNFNNINRGDGGRGQGGRGDGGNWKHNPEHRGGAPYGDKATANKFGGSARGDTRGDRGGTGVGQQGGRQTGGATNRAGGTGVSNRASGAGAGGAGVDNRGTGTGGRPSATNRGTGAAGQGGGDKIGSRNIPSSSGSRGKSGGSGGSSFSGGSRGYSGSSARASSSRGSRSMGSRGGGGGRGGGRR